MEMSDKEIAKKIVKYFLANCAFRRTDKSLKKLLEVGLSGAFIWADTKEGHGFWADFGLSRNLGDWKNFRSFMIHNYIVNQTNFIELKLFI